MFQNPTVPLAPMTPDTVLSAFRYLRAVEAGNTEAAAGLPTPIRGCPNCSRTSRSGSSSRSPRCAASARTRATTPSRLEAVGRVLTATLRTWAQAGPDTVEGVAHAVIAFVRQVLTQEEIGETAADVLRQMEAVGFGQALDAHPVRSTAA